VRVIAISAVGLASVVLLAGCGSSETGGGTSSNEAARLAVEDLRTLVTVSPNATGWSWTVDPRTRLRSPTSFELDTSEPSYAIQKAVTDALVDAGWVKAATSDWWDDEEGKKASSFANLVATPEGASKAMEADHEFARHWFPDFEHQQIREIDADGIGEQSWAVAGGSDTAGFVEIGWTRGNAVLSVYVNCSPCRANIADATRRWAKKIDDTARVMAD
jgi:hypothetical protein